MSKLDSLNSKSTSSRGVLVEHDVAIHEILKTNLFYYLVLVISIFALSQFFGASKLFAAGEDAQGYITSILSFLVFIHCIIYLAMRIYFEERARGNLRVKVALFEALGKRFGWL